VQADGLEGEELVVVAVAVVVDEAKEARRTGDCESYTVAWGWGIEENADIVNVE
jgi:hypothetical protein